MTYIIAFELLQQSPRDISLLLTICTNTLQPERNIMRASFFMLILAVLLSSSLAMPYEDRDEQKSPNIGILQHLVHQYKNGKKLCKFVVEWIGLRFS